MSVVVNYVMHSGPNGKCSKRGLTPSDYWLTDLVDDFAVCFVEKCVYLCFVCAMLKRSITCIAGLFCIEHSIILAGSPTKMWSSNNKVWSPKWENEESNFWHGYSFTFKMMANSYFYALTTVCYVKIWNYWRILHNSTFKPKNVSFWGTLSPRAPTRALPLEPHAGSGVVRIDPLRFLAGCRTRRLNQA